MPIIMALLNGWVLPNEHFTGIWKCTVSSNELTYRTFRGLGQKTPLSLEPK
jgi:hypothetical protein